MKLLNVIVSCLLVFSLVSCSGYQAKTKQLTPPVKIQTKGNKPVILFVVDSLMTGMIDKGLQKNDLPTLRYLIDKGTYHKNMVSIFPTMSVAIDSSLLTGTFPDQHHVPGLTWYSKGEQRMVNYGTGPVEIAKSGVTTVVTDAMKNLNDEHLNKRVSTLHEDLDRQGFSTGSLNGLVFRGNTAQQLTLSPWMHLPTSLPSRFQVMGPDLLWYGKFMQSIPAEKDAQESPFSRYGFNNDFSISVLQQLIKTNSLPDFLIVYLPDLDQKLHKYGLHSNKIEKVLKQTDHQLGQILDSFGSREVALNRAVFMIMGDSGQTPIGSDKKESLIRLDEYYNPDITFEPGEKLTNQQVTLAINERMAYVYRLQTEKTIEELIQPLQSNANIDIIAWDSGEWINVMRGGSSKGMRFKEKGPYFDTFGQSWTIEGKTEFLQLSIKGNKLQYTDYPDALRQLKGALHSHEGDYIVITAKPGHEFASKHSPTHVGGAGHGSLYKEDMIVPLIISGTDKTLSNPRIVDLKPFIMNVLQSPTP